MMDISEHEISIVFLGVRRFNLLILLLLAIILLNITGCGTLQNGRGWGQDAIHSVELKRISNAAYHAFFDLQTLLPAAGALAFSMNHYDNRVSEWAATHHPIFGSDNTPRNVSNDLVCALGVETLLTALATPSGKNPEEWIYNKTKGVGVELGAELATTGITNLLKDTIKHPRPNGGDNTSFPSGHSSNAFSSAALANRNLNSIHMPEQARLPLQIGNNVLATGVSWARVEEGAHYPSDVLAGAALGHFISAFFYDAFMGIPERKRWGLNISPGKGGAMIGVSFGF